MLDVDPPVQILIVFILFTSNSDFTMIPSSIFMSLAVILEPTLRKCSYSEAGCNSNRDWNTNLNLLLCQFDSIDEHAELLNDQMVRLFELIFQLFNFALHGYRLFTFPPIGAPIFEPRLTNKNVTCELK